MPEIGEIKSSRELGLPGNHRRQWVVCPKCGTGRWRFLSVIKREEYTGLCHHCNASLHGRLKSGGRWVNSQGYVLILLQPDDFFFPMVGKDNYVFEHRLVMAQHLGRCLHSWEIVHHKNHKRADNRFENLQLISDTGHKQLSRFEAKVESLKRENKQLKIEIEKLKAEVKRNV